MVLKELILTTFAGVHFLTVSTLQGCGSLESPGF